MPCHAVVAVSENIRELSVRAGVARERIEVIPDGIEFPADLSSASERTFLRSRWDCTDDDFVVGLLGAATPEKGQDVAIEAVTLLAERLPRMRLILAGDECTAGIEPGRSANAGDSRILRLGPIEDLAHFFPGLDLFIMPSKAEGLGSSSLWAMAYALPVVATRVGGLPEIVIEDETGWLISPGSAQALADAILSASRDRSKLAALGRSGRQRAEAFSADIMVSRTEALYRRLLSANSR